MLERNGSIRKVRRSSRLPAHSDTSEALTEKVQKIIMTVDAADVEDSSLGSETTYIGPSKPVLNGVSSMKTSNGTPLALCRGTPVRVCTRPTIAFGTTAPSVRVHFSVHVKGHVDNCVCGACGFTFDHTQVAPEPCACGTEVYDEGKQPCAIM